MRDRQAPGNVRSPLPRPRSPTLFSTPPAPASGKSPSRPCACWLRWGLEAKDLERTADLSPMGFDLYWRRYRVRRLYHLALRYFQQDNLLRAERCAMKAFTALRGLGRPSSLTVPLVCLLAQIYKKSGKDLSAGRIFQVAIQLLKKCYGDRSVKVGVALHELGVTLSRAGVPERAIEALEEAIPILEECSGKDHPDVASALTNLGLAQSQAKRYGDAERTQRRVIAMREATLGLHDPEVSQALNNLSVTSERQSRSTEALDCLRRALAIRETHLGPDHPNVGRDLNIM